MIMELSAEEMDARAQVFTSLKTSDMERAFVVLSKEYNDVRREDGYIRIYDVDDTAAIVDYLMKNGQAVTEISRNKIGLEEYYIELMSKKEAE